MTSSRRTAASSRIAWLASLWVAGCAPSHPAVQERFTHPTTGTRETISLACEGDSASRSPNPPSDDPRRGNPAAALRDRNPPVLVLRATDDLRASGECVGTMYSQPSVLGEVTPYFHAIPLYLAEETGLQALQRAASEELTAAGFAVEARPRPGARAIDLRLESLWVESQAAKWHDLRGPITAHVAWSISVGDSLPASAVWERRFEESIRTEVVYFLKADHEALLRRAWCTTLARLREEIAAPSFRVALGDSLDAD